MEDELKITRKELQSTIEKLENSNDRLKVLSEEATAAKDHLETRVKERTAELEKANRALQEESAERQRAEQAVKAERQRFNDVLEALPAYVILLTPDYHVSFANKFFRDRFGEDHGRRCFEYLFNRTEPCEICETYKVLKTESPQRWEWMGPDGRDYDIHDFPFTDTDGSTLILEMGIDITERKQAEEELRHHKEHLEDLVKERTAELGTRNAQLAAEIAEHRRTEDDLRESEERYRSLFDNMTEGFALHEIITDENGRPCDYRFLSINPSFERLTGLKRADVLGKRVLEVLPNNDPHWIEAYGKVALTGEPMCFENFATPLNRWYEVFAYKPCAAPICSDLHGHHSSKAGPTGRRSRARRG